MQGTVNNGSSGIKVFHLAETINTINPFGINNAYHLSYIDTFNVELMDKDGNKKVFNYKTKTWADSTSDDTKENLALTKWGDYYYKVVPDGIEKYDKDLKLVKNVPFQNGITPYGYPSRCKISYDKKYAYSAFMDRKYKDYLIVFDKDLNIKVQFDSPDITTNNDRNTLLNDMIICYSEPTTTITTFSLTGSKLNSLKIRAEACIFLADFSRKSLLIKTENNSDIETKKVTIGDDGTITLSDTITYQICNNVKNSGENQAVAFDMNDFCFDTITEHNSEIVYIRQKIKTNDANAIYCNSANFNRVVICRYSTNNSNLIFEVYNRK